MTSFNLEIIIRIILIRNFIKRDLPRPGDLGQTDMYKNPTSPQSPSQSIETLCAALLYMMSYYSHSKDPQLASEIARHLSWLKDAARLQGYKGLDETAGRLLALHWKNGESVH